MLADLFQVGERCLLALEDGTHATQSGTLEALASVRGVSVFDHADHIAGNGVDQRTSSVDLTQSKLVMVPVVKSVTEIGIKGMDIVQTREVRQHCGKTFRNGLLSEFHLSHAVKQERGHELAFIHYNRKRGTHILRYPIDSLTRKNEFV